MFSLNGRGLRGFPSERYSRPLDDVAYWPTLSRGAAAGRGVRARPRQPRATGPGRGQPGGLLGTGAPARDGQRGPKPGVGVRRRRGSGPSSAAPADGPEERGGRALRIYGRAWRHRNRVQRQELHSAAHPRWRNGVGLRNRHNTCN